MEPRFAATVDGNLISRVNLLQFIRAFLRASDMGQGFYIEFGVLNGASMIEAWGILRGLLTHIYGFDSFFGLPKLSEDDLKSKNLMPSFDQGNFSSMSCKRVQETIIASTYGLDPALLTLIEGLYEESLPLFDISSLKDQGPCLVVHVDCDLYSSSLDVFHFIESVATTGTWLLLDDYWCYRGSPNHGQRRAFEEWLVTSRFGATAYTPYGGFCQSFILYEK
jgi:O-methyltransferase